MTTYDEYIKNLPNIDKPVTDTRTIRLAIQAAVSADLLMNDKNWDAYLRYIQFGIEKITEQISAYEERLHDVRMVDQNTIMQIKITLADLNGKLFALNWALALPTDIKANGDLARKLHEKS